MTSQTGKIPYGGERLAKAGPLPRMEGGIYGTRSTDSPSLFPPSIAPRQAQGYESYTFSFCLHFTIQMFIKVIHDC